MEAVEVEGKNAIEGKKEGAEGTKEEKGRETPKKVRVGEGFGCENGKKGSDCAKEGTLTPKVARLLKQKPSESKQNIPVPGMNTRIAFVTATHACSALVGQQVSFFFSQSVKRRSRAPICSSPPENLTALFFSH